MILALVKLRTFPSGRMEHPNECRSAAGGGRCVESQRPALAGPLERRVGRSPTQDNGDLIIIYSADYARPIARDPDCRHYLCRIVKPETPLEPFRWTGVQPRQLARPGHGGPLMHDGLIRLLTPRFDKTTPDPAMSRAMSPACGKTAASTPMLRCGWSRPWPNPPARTRHATPRDAEPIHHARTPAQVAVYQVEPYAVAADEWVDVHTNPDGERVSLVGAPAFLFLRCTSTGTGALMSRHRILTVVLTREPWNPTAIC